MPERYYRNDISGRLGVGSTKDAIYKYNLGEKSGSTCELHHRMYHVVSWLPVYINGESVYESDLPDLPDLTYLT